MLEIVDARTSPARITVFGVGGGGSNAVNRMIQAGLSGVDFWIGNTDLQALEQAACSNRLQIGRGVTRGLGAGGDPEMGRLSAEEDRESIAGVLKGADMLFITAGMGGGTGTGGAPVVAEVARELGILTVAIVTKPFLFEGKKKISRAQAGLAELGRHVDTLICIPNQKLLNIVEPGTPFRAAMLVADEVLFQATRGISDLITGHGEINLDFADVKTVMRNRGNALLGCGVASGKDRSIEAAQAAVSSPLLEEVSIDGAEALLINVQGGPGMGLHEAAEAAQFISERVGEEADVFWGAVVDPELEDEMRVTLIATGFPRTEARPSAAAAPAREEAVQKAPRAPGLRGNESRDALPEEDAATEIDGEPVTRVSAGTDAEVQDSADRSGASREAAVREAGRGTAGRERAGSGSGGGATVSGRDAVPREAPRPAATAKRRRHEVPVSAAQAREDAGPEDVTERPGEPIGDHGGEPAGADEIGTETAPHRRSVFERLANLARGGSGRAAVESDDDAGPYAGDGYETAPSREFGNDPGWRDRPPVSPTADPSAPPERSLPPSRPAPEPAPSVEERYASFRTPEASPQQSDPQVGGAFSLGADWRDDVFFSPEDVRRNQPAGQRVTRSESPRTAPDPRRAAAPPAGSSGSGRTSWRDGWTQAGRPEPTLDSRIGRRNPLDEPTFMRKRMD